MTITHKKAKVGNVKKQQAWYIQDQEYIKNHLADDLKKIIF